MRYSPGLIIMALLFLFLSGCRDRENNEVGTEILETGSYHATIGWRSLKPGKGVIHYKESNGDSKPLKAYERGSASYAHEVTLKGLKPSTRYTYRVNSSKTRYQLQTRPLSGSPFSFLIVKGDVKERIFSLVSSEYPEFIISLTDITSLREDPFISVRPYLLIFDCNGADSPFLRSIDDEKKYKTDSWYLDWAGLRLVFIKPDFFFGTDDLSGIIESSAVETTGIITASEGLGLGPDKKDPDFKNTRLHRAILKHNEKRKAGSVAFIGLVDRADLNKEIDGISYFSFKGEESEENSHEETDAIRIDVDLETVRAVFIDQGREVNLKNPPLKQKRTCEECRKLADKGAYEESVKAYKAFIDSNKGHFQVEDACFAIAGISDNRLFRFGEALKWYKKLAKEYPDGTLAPLANQRIRYLEKYGDYDFKPLIKFESIKQRCLTGRNNEPAKRKKIIYGALGCADSWPDSKLAPLIIYWAARQYRDFDIGLSAAAYKRLKKSYPKHELSRVAMLETCELYYQANEYEKARSACKIALSDAPEHTKTILFRLKRIKRNELRDFIFKLFCLIIPSLFFGAAVFCRPAGGVFNFNQIYTPFLLLSACILIPGWIINEQFASIYELMMIAFSFSGSSVLASFISVVLVKAFMGKSYSFLMRAAAGSIAGVIFFLMNLYLFIYLINPHYLTIVKL